MPVETFGQRLKTAMQVCGMTNGNLSKVTGLPVAHISHITGNEREPNMQTLRQILKAMPNIDARWLVLG